MLTLNHHPSPRRVDLNLTGHSHGRNAELTATEDNFRPDKVSVRFQIGDHTPGRRRIVQLTQRPGLTRPDLTHIRGTVTHRGMVHGLAGIVSAPDQEGVVTYRGQVERKDMFLRASTDEFGSRNISGRVGNENVDMRVRNEHGRIDISGSVGRESVSLRGHDYGSVDKFPMPGIVSAIAFSAFFNQNP